jgi:hypothetical protein
MKKFTIFLFLLVVTSYASAQSLFIRTNPVLVLVGIASAELQIKLSSNITAGLGINSGTISDGINSVSLNEQHIKLDYWTRGAMKQGWFFSIQYSSLKAKGEEESLFGDEILTGELNTSGFGLGVAYRWLWTSFFIEFGFESIFYDDLTFKLQNADGTSTSETTASSASGMQFNLGWNF